MQWSLWVKKQNKNKTKQKQKQNKTKQTKKQNNPTQPKQPTKQPTKQIKKESNIYQLEKDDETMDKMKQIFVTLANFGYLISVLS